MDPRVLSLELSLEGFEPSAFRVLRMEATEALSEGCSVHVEAETEELLELDPLLGTKASLWIRFRRDGTEERPFHGVVTGADLEATRPGALRLHVVISARVELLKLGRNARIFQEKSVREVVSSVLEEGGLAGGYSWELSKEAPPHPNSVQYNESDFAFISRLLHEEGIAFVVHHGEDAEQLLFFDDSTGLQPIAGNSVLVDRASSQLDEDVIIDLHDAWCMAPDQVYMRDQDFKRPSVDLSARERSKGATGREVYDHPGGYTELAAGRTRAKRLLECLRVGTHVLSGQSTCPRMEPGRTFAVSEHGRVEANRHLLITRVVHRAFVASGSGGQDSYTNEVTGIPVEVPYRPARAPAAPVMGGTQVAFITGASGGEIHTDSFGRVKVRLPWDRSGHTDDRSSTWLRVGQHPLSGSMIIPRVGFEVLVDFELGDFDRPFVAGHLYNAEQGPPYALPGGATRSALQSATTGGGPGANELCFEDVAGGELILFNASKDYALLVDNDAELTIANEERCSVGSNSVLSVGGNHYANVSGSGSLDVGANQNVDVGGDYSDGVGGDLQVRVGGARMVKVGGDLAESVQGSLRRTVAALQVVTGVAGFTRKVVGSSTTKVGAAWLELAGRSRLVSVGTVFKETVGALKLIKAKQLSVSCGAGYVMNAAAEKVTCGGNRTDSAKGAVALTAGGGMKVKASNITLSAQNKLVVRGGACTVELSADGSVKIKAPTVIIKNNKVLNQVLHKSN